MTNRRFIRKATQAALATLFVGGALYGFGCTASDIQKNLVKGTLNYVSGNATSFWGAAVPIDWDEVFNRNAEE